MRDATATDCSFCGLALPDSAREVGPNRYACSTLCEEKLEGAFCRECGSWVPEGDHAENCPAVDPHERILDAAWEEGRFADDSGPIVCGEWDCEVAS